MKWCQEEQLVTRRFKKSHLRRDVNKFINKLFAKLPDCDIAMSVLINYQVDTDGDIDE